MPAIRKPVTATQETKVRASIFDRRDRMAFQKNPKYYMQWVNDVRSDVQDYLDAGFTFVDEEERWGKEPTIDGGTGLDSRAQVNVGRAGGQENVTAYLMKIPRAEWEAITAPIKEEARRPMQEVLRQKEEMKKDGFYGDVTIK